MASGAKHPVGVEWPFPDTAGNYRYIYQKLSVFIEYHSLVGQVNLYICISDIIGISAKSAVSIRRLSHF